MNQHSKAESKAKKKALKKEALEVLKQGEYAYIEELISACSFSISTFYKYKLNKNKKILELISNNKVLRKAKMRDRWEKKDQAPVLQLAAYKLLATDEELDRLNSNKNQDKGNDTPAPVHIVLDKELSDYKKKLESE